MYKELHELLDKMRNQLLNSQGITLSRKELSMIIRYLNELEIEISNGVD